MTIADRLQVVHSQIAEACQRCDRDPDTVDLLPVSKRHPKSAILECQAAGIDTFGENRVQELVEKSADLVDNDITWHLIGSLQTNKVNQVLRVPSLALVQSLDRIRLANVMQSALADTAGSQDVLLQVDATSDETKHGVRVEETRALLEYVTRDCPNLRPVGLMAMGPVHGAAAPVFRAVADLRRRLQQSSGLPLPTLSIGMTGDMPAAIAAGSTMVRVGTGIFGPRLPLTPR